MEFQTKAQIISTSSAKVECARFGRGKKPLVILPGLSIKSLMPLAEAVAERYKKFLDDYEIFLMERPIEPPEGCDSNFLAKAAIEALDALGVKGACLLGISAGGMAAQEVAADRPDLVSKLFLGSTCAKMTKAATALIGNWAELAQKEKAADLNQAFAKAVYSQGFYHKYKDAILASLEGATRYDLKRFSILARAILDFDATFILPKIQCPILAVGAEEDQIFGSEAARKIASLAGNSAQSYVYKNYGHAVYDEAGDYPDRILAFFAD